MNDKLKEHIKEIKRKSELEIFSLLVSDKHNDSMYEFSKLGICLHSIANCLDINLFLKILDKLTIPDGFRLILKQEGFENSSHYNLYIVCPDGSEKENIFDYILVDNSTMGAWQAYLLYNLWHVLPLYNHCLYDYRQYFFLIQDIDTMTFLVDEDEDELTNLKAEFKKCFHPLKVLQYNNQFFISCCYWSEFEGLIEEVVELYINNGKIIEFHNLNDNELYCYNSGVCF